MTTLCAFLSATASQAAPEPCAVTPSQSGSAEVTCTGDQSGGVGDADLTVPAGAGELLLRIFGLSTDIAPPIDTDGVSIGDPAVGRPGSIRVEVDTGPRTLRARGDNPIGIGITATDGDVDVRLAGRVEARGEGTPDPIGTVGIFARVLRGVGDATATLLSGAVVDVGATSPASAANLPSTTAGVVALASRGDARVVSAGSIRVAARELARGVVALAADGDASISLSGNTDVSGDASIGVSVEATGVGAEPGRAVIRLAEGSRVTVRGNNSVGILASGGSRFAATQGSVEVVAAGDVEVLGEDNTGIGLRAEGGDAEVTVSRRVAAPGRNSIGILAESAGGRNDVRLAPGSEVLGTIAAFLIDGSSDPNAPNRVAIAAGAALRGGLRGGDGADWIDNAGRFDLSGPAVLGAGDDHIENRGRLNPGGRDRIETVQLRGLETLRQSETGVLEIDLDPTTQRVDQIDFSDATALDLAGRVEVRERETPEVDLRRGLQNSYTLLSTAGPLRDNGLRVDDTVVLDYDLVSSGGALRLDRTVLGFRPAGLQAHDADAIAAYLNRIAERPDGQNPSGAALLRPLAQIREFGIYRDVLARLGPRPYHALLPATWHAEQAFAEALWRGCEGAGESESNSPCLWASVTGRQLERRAGDRGGDFSDRSIGPRGGVRVSLGRLGPLSLSTGLGLSYEDVALELAHGGRAEGDRVLGGIALHGRLPLEETRPGRSTRLELDLAADGGFSWYDARRRVDFAGVADARSDPEVGFAGLHGRVALRWGSRVGEPGLYGRLGLEGNAVYISADDLDEVNAGHLALRIDEVRELYGALRPGIEIGGLWPVGGFSLRPYTRLAGTFLLGDVDTSLRGRFASAPRAAGAANVRGGVDRHFIDVGAGLALSRGEHLELRLGYDGRFAPNGDTRSHQGSLRVEVRF